MANVCPCCGHQSDKAPPFFVDDEALVIHVDGKQIRLTPAETQVAKVMEGKYPGSASNSFVVDCLFGDDPSGGPEYAEKMTSLRVHYIRKKLSETPLRIENVWGSGYKFVYEDSPHE